MITLRAGLLEASFEPGAGMVGVSLKHRGEEVLGQRDGLRGWVSDRKTFGIPLLHPWANRLGGWSYGQVEIPEDSPEIKKEEHGLPIHGLLFGRPEWTVESATDDSAEASLAFDRPEWLALFPFPHTLRVSVALEDTALVVSTRVRATGVFPVPLAFGWHPYLHLPGVPFGEWSVETSVREELKLDQRGIPFGPLEDRPVEAGPLESRAFDNLYADGDEAWLSLTGGGRAIWVRFLDGYSHAQLFADQEQQVFAFEPMMAPTDALRSGEALRSVAPGHEAHAAFRIAVVDA